MANPRVLDKRRKSIKNIRKITRTMELIATARFKKAMQRAREQVQKGAKGQTDPQVTALLNQLRATTAGGERILIRSAERILFLKPEEIDHLEAAGNYVVLHAGKDRHILRETTTAMEARLAPAGFMRINRSVIVNLSRVREVQPLGPGQYCVQLKNGSRFDMTCSLRELQARLAEV
jgi:two-component system LytT family response regulator